MRSPRQYLALLRHLGLGWVLYRSIYAVRRRSGLLRRGTRAVAWQDLPAPVLHLPRSAVIPAIDKSWGEACVKESEAVLRGEFRLFSDRTVNAGTLPEWSRNQITDEQLPSTKHWTDLGDFAHGDIKGVWELSRFPWAFTLVRAFARSPDVRYSAAFWRLFADWCQHNPPNLGPNWMCGQEATFRLMAVVFAAESLRVPAEQRTALARFVVASGQRIAANLDYALSQKNNHGISECVGLITAALLVPEFAASAGWLERGLRELKSQVDELVYEDGGFAQHSLIYHRVLLHDLCWCRRRLLTAGFEIPAWLDSAGRRALDFLTPLVDPVTGLAPLYGSNDGASVLPLAEAGFLDMRPVVQMAAAAFREELVLPEGPWDEAAAWMVPDWEEQPRRSWPPTPARWHAAASGCFQLLNGRDRLFMRCPEQFRHRPAQADMLHVDIWHEGRQVAHDGGSFSYNSKERFVAFSSAAQHNGLTVDGMEPLEKFSRFLYLPWPQGRAGENDAGNFQASHDGYAQLGVQWTREVSVRNAGGFSVCDRVSSVAGRKLVWHWRLADAPWRMGEKNDSVEALGGGLGYSVRWSGLAGCRSRLFRADDNTAYGWWSPHYGSVEPAVSLVIEVEAGGDVELVTEFCPLG